MVTGRGVRYNASVNASKRGNGPAGPPPARGAATAERADGRDNEGGFDLVDERGTRAPLRRGAEGPTIRAGTRRVQRTVVAALDLLDGRGGERVTGPEPPRKE